jgi:large subunit ribosomal protein L23
MSKTMILRPRLSEKAYGLSQAKSTYVFEVPANANKMTVSQAVAVQFEVAVTNVNIANSKGKPKRTIRKGGRPGQGRRSNTKKAYVTLKSGDTIPIFAAEEQAAADAAKADAQAAKKEKK